jgi:hypothetical protein
MVLAMDANSRLPRELFRNHVTVVLRPKVSDVDVDNQSAARCILDAFTQLLGQCPDFGRVLFVCNAWGCLSGPPGVTVPRFSQGPSTELQ